MMPETQVKPKRTPADRPFPWRCPRCLATDAVNIETIAYTAEIGHDGQVYHLEIPQFKVPRCQSCKELIVSHGADHQIRTALRSHLGLLTAEQIRVGREELGLSQEELASRLGIAPATFARWEEGGSIQPQSMDELLRSHFNSQAHSGSSSNFSSNDAP